MSWKLLNFIALSVCLCMGCSPLHALKFPTKKVLPDPKEAERREEQQHRAKYQATRSSKEFQWLQEHRLENGMTLETVNHLLGQKGKRIDGAGENPADSDAAHKHDGAYRYGPDDQGHTLQLTFKNGRVVDYVNPKESASLPQKPAKATVK